MILHELLGTEHHPTYQALEVSNGGRQYDFLVSVVEASVRVERPFLSSYVLKALNFHAIACLHTNPGEYRPCAVRVQTVLEDGSVQVDHDPPPYFLVQALMDDMVNMVNRGWERADALALAAFVLWRLNWIHPFINGNGRTARAACYFVLCLKFGGTLPGKKTLPELLKVNRPRYVEALRQVDESTKTGPVNLSPLHALLQELLGEQLASAEAPEEEPVIVQAAEPEAPPAANDEPPTPALGNGQPA